MDYLCSECSTQLSKFEIELNTQFPIGKLYCEFCQNKKERESGRKVIKEYGTLPDGEVDKEDVEIKLDDRF